MTAVLPIPLHRGTFISVEGESSRVGEMTAFVKGGDGPMRSVDWAVKTTLDIAKPFRRWVVNTSDVHHYDWEPFVRDAVDYWYYAKQLVVLETRGERVVDVPVPKFILYTPGLTKETPQSLDPTADEVKMLVHSWEEIQSAIETLHPFAEAGMQCFLYPRVDPIEYKRGGALIFFETFMRHVGTTRIRMALLEHEVIGID